MHPVQNRFCFLLALALSAGTPLSLSSQTLKIFNIRAWDAEKRAFSSPRDISVKNGKIESWEKSSQKSKEPVKFILPTFCDAGVTLGSNSWDGKLSLKDINQNLMSFTALGFSHILSIGDGKGIDRLSEEILKGQRTGPVLLTAEKVFLGHAGEDLGQKPDLSHRFHFLLSDESDCPASATKNRIHPFFLKKKEGDGFSQRQLNACLSKIRERSGISIAYTFGEKELWEEGVLSGFKIFYQTMPMSWDESDIRYRDIWWSPQLTVTKMSTLRNKPDEIRKILRFWAKKNPQLNTAWLEKNLETIPTPTESSSRIDSNEKSLLSSFPPAGKTNLLFSSGSGFFGVLPGIAPLQEAYLWEKFLFNSSLPVLEEKETESEVDWKFWKPSLPPFVLGALKPDPSKVPESRIQLLEALTQNTCEFLGTEHKGRIELGGAAFFSIYPKNPLESPLGLFEIESVVHRGKLVYTQEREKKGKQK